MSRFDHLARVEKSGLVAIMRADSGERLLDVTEALADGGIEVVEVTFTTPGAIDILKLMKHAFGDRLLIGAGTVLDPETARAAILAGAEFLVTPCVNVDVIRLGNRYDKLVCPGAFTPTEVLTAWDAGAPLIKLFPAEIGGPAHVQALKGPFPQIPLMATGGVTLETLPAFFKAGVSAVGLGGSLVPKSAIAAGDYERITGIARQFVELMASVREAQTPRL